MAEKPTKESSVEEMSKLTDWLTMAAQQIGTMRGGQFCIVILKHAEGHLLTGLSVNKDVFGTEDEAGRRAVKQALLRTADNVDRTPADGEAHLVDWRKA